MNIPGNLSRLLRPSGECLACLNSPNVNIFGIISVRFRKRRDTVPQRAPSKIYYVRKPTPIDPDERDILFTEYCKYRTQMKSVVAFLRCQGRPINFMYKEKQVTDVDEEADLMRAIEINNQWNAEIAEARNSRLAEEETQRQKIQEKKLSKELERLEVKQRHARETIQRKASRRENAINMDNLDEELERFLDGPITNHNFAITPSGDKHTGDTTSSASTTESTETTSSVQAS